ncbi:MAG: LysR family transcriptional regulator [Rhodospirillales bacterium]|nr:LysR family transcriptional regulator [Rhodospirillales bacterium]
MDALAGMAVYAKVVEAHGFSAAARELGMSKSAVSKQVAALEARLGARLLNRTTRRLSLTDAGAVFHDRCLRLLADAEEAAAAVGSLQAEPRGLLRVNAPMSFGILHLAPAVPEFAARHPDITVDLTLNDRVVDLVEEGYDVAVRIARLPDSTLVARRLAPSRRLLCASPDYLARHGVPQRPADLKGHNCLLYTSATTRPEDWRFTGPDGEVSVRVSGTLRANNGDVLRAAAVAGLGLALLPSFLAGPDLCAGRLRAVMPDYGDDGGAVYAVYPGGRYLSAKVRAFVDFLAARFGPRPYWEPEAPSE